MKKVPVNQQSFDLEAIYDAKIAPLMDQIIGICKEHKLPMFATFLYMNDPDGDDGLCTTNLMFKERPIPEKLLNLVTIADPPRIAALRISVKKGDGSVEETVILG